MFNESPAQLRPLLALPLLAAVAFCDDEFLAARRRGATRAQRLSGVGPG